jgi:large subunit ribosomal protein L5
MTLQEKYKKIVVPGMQNKFGYKNAMAIPRLVKAVVNSGVGRFKDEKQKEEVKAQLEKIAGQKFMDRGAKIAIASFKTRLGMTVGYSATLRGKRMYDLFEKMVTFTIPRMRDFRGLEDSIVDQGGNLTIGFKEHILFPEMVGEDVRNIFGFQITFVTTAKKREEALEFFRLMGVPFRK